MDYCKKLVFIVLFISMVICSKPSYAFLIVGDMDASEEQLGDFEATLTYNPLNSITGTLSISLKNTSDISNGGYLTAFVFNNPNDYLTSAILSSTNYAGFGLLGLSDDGISVSPYGYFDLGASTSADFLGGGNPNTGIGVSETGLFVFTLNGTNLNMLSEADFVNTFSQNGNNSEFFLARFRGFNNGGSDKVPGEYDPVIPEPLSMFLLSLGSLAFGIFKRKKRQ